MDGMIGRAAIGGWCVRWSVLLRLPRLTAWLFLKSVRFVGPEGGERILCVQRSIFVDDVRAVASVEPAFRFGLLPKAKLDDVMRVFVERDPEAAELNEFTYHQGCCADSLIRFREYLDQVIEHLLAMWSAKALLSGNFGYTQQQELARLFEKRGLPFIVLFKEGLVLPSQLDNMRTTVVNRKKFLGTKILFYSEQIQSAVLESDAFENCKFDSAVCGIPRLDSLANAPAAAERRLVFFSFFPNDKFRYFGLDDATRKEACALGDAFHVEVLRFAQQNSDWEITIKTKAGEKYVDYVEERIAELGERPPNVRLTNAGNAADLLLESQGVIAFMSTTGIEALVANRTVICPDFGKFFGDREWDYFTECPELVNYVTTANEIKAALTTESAHSQEWIAKRDSFLLEMVNGADGQASARVAREIQSCLTSAAA